MSAFGAWFKRGVLPLVTLMGLATLSCAQPDAAEATRSVTLKQLAPDPLMKFSASSETTAAYGITEWRFYRGRGGIFATGYDAKGKPVKGISTTIGRTDDGTINALELKVNDGSKTALHHALDTRHTALSAPMPVRSQAFLRRAMLDFARTGVASSLRLRRLGAGATIADVCGATLPNSFTALALCLANARGSAASAQRCQVAAQLAGTSRADCRGLSNAQGGVIDPLPPGISSTNLGSICGGDPTCGSDMNILQSEETFGIGCGDDLSCQTQGFGFDPFAGPGAGGGGMIFDDRPSVGGLSIGNAIPSSSCVGGGCVGDQGTGFTCLSGCAAFQQPSFQCVSGDCAAFQGQGQPEQIGNFTCQNGFCSDTTNATANTGNGTEQIGNFTCQNGFCSDTTNATANTGNGTEQIGNFTCQNGFCSDTTNATANTGNGTEQFGNFTCQSNGSCSDTTNATGTTGNGTEQFGNFTCQADGSCSDTTDRPITPDNDNGGVQFTNVNDTFTGGDDDTGGLTEASFRGGF